MKPERQLQRAIVDYLSILEKQGRLFFFAVPNGGSRNVIEAKNLKRDGVRAGVSDLVIVCPGHVYFVEVKAAKGRPSAAQYKFADDLIRFGQQYAVVRSVRDVIMALHLWGILSDKEAKV